MKEGPGGATWSLPVGPPRKQQRVDAALLCHSPPAAAFGLQRQSRPLWKKVI